MSRRKFARCIISSSDSIDGIQSGVGERLRLARLNMKPKWTQAKVSKDLGVSTPTIVRYESGEIVPSIHYIEYAIRNFNIDAHWLLTGEKADRGETEIPDSEYDYIDDIEDLPSEEFWGCFQQIISDPEWRGWYKIELIKRFPELVEQIKKRRDLDHQAALERSQAVGE